MLYPLKFEPILKHRLWGGNKLEKVLGKKHSSDHAIGESWELSGMPGDESVVINGPLAGNSINELLEIYMDELVGAKVFDKYGFTFPLLFKFIDANDKLSIQVHPSDEIAAEQDSFGKTEMWYVIDAEEGAELILGFSEKMDQVTLAKHIESNTLETVLNKIQVEKGDVFFIPSGTIHSIGKGILLAEVQQASDLTYRLYDYNRKDSDGNSRQLHVTESLENINYDTQAKEKVSYQIETDSVSLVSCSYFNINLLSFDTTIKKDYSDLDSFVVYMCLEGSLEIKWGQDLKESISKGETVLLPADINSVELFVKKNAEVLEVFVDGNR